MNRFLMLLRWVRKDDSPFQRGYTRGFMNAIQDELEPWEYQYLKVITDHHLMGDMV